MFGKLFGKLMPTASTAAKDASGSGPDAVGGPEAALLAAIERQKKTDPLIGAKIAGKDLANRLLAALKDDKGEHVESLLCALGSLAGYACQASLREQAIGRKMSPDAAFQIARTKDGQRFFFGDPLNSALAGGQLSVWSLAAGAAQHNGAQKLPDINGIFQRTAANIGSAEFGVPRTASGHAASELPIAYLRRFWPALLPFVKKLTGDPQLWPVAYGFAIQDAMDMTKTAIPAELALSIVMEAAIPMSKVDLKLG